MTESGNGNMMEMRSRTLLFFLYRIRDNFLKNPPLTLVLIMKRTCSFFNFMLNFVQKAYPL